MIGASYDNSAYDYSWGCTTFKTGTLFKQTNEKKILTLQVVTRVTMQKICQFVPAPPLVGVEPNPGPPKNNNIPEATRWRIVFLSTENKLSPTKISRKVKCSRQEVYEILAKYKDTGTVHDRQRSGRKHQLDDDDKKFVIKRAKTEKMAKEIADELDKKRHKKVNEITVRRHLRSAGLRPLKDLEEEALTEAHIAKRLEYANKMIDYDWNKVIFSDEKPFWIGTGSSISWRKPGQQKRHKVKRFPPKLNVWGGIGYYFKTKLYYFTDNMDGKLYRQVIKSRLKETEITYSSDCPRRLRKKWIFLQDGAKAHTAKESKEVLNDLVGKRVVDHPAMSPDFNVMEDAWSYLDRKKRRANPQSIKALKTLLTKEWENMDFSEIRKSVDSMPRRLQQCRDRQGARTSY